MLGNNKINRQLSDNEKIKKLSSIIIKKKHAENFLKSQRKSKEKNKPNISSALLVLSEIHFDLGNYKQAKKYLKQALRIDKAIYKNDKRRLAISYGNYAAALNNIGDLVNARRYKKFELELTEEFVGKDNPDITCELLEYASILRRLGDFEIAKRHVTRALKINKKAKNTYLTNRAFYFGRIAEEFYHLGDFGKTWICLRHAKKYNSLSFKYEPSNVARNLNQIGQVLYILGDFIGSKRYYKRALKVYIDGYGDFGSLTVAYYLLNLGDSLKEIGEFESAIESYKHSIDILKIFFPTNHINIIDARNSLGEIMIKIPIQK